MCNSKRFLAEIKEIGKRFLFHPIHGDTREETRKFFSLEI